MNKEIMKIMGLGGHVEEVEKGVCPFCKKEINMNDFKDELSKKEFKISGICQNCQDKIFN